MRKKSLLAAIVLVLSVGLVACGDKNVNSDNKNETQTQATKKEIGFVYENKGLTMNIDGDVTEYVAKLGEPTGYYEAKSCAFEGLDKFWYYDGFTLQGYQKDGKDLLYAITFDDDTVKTKEGVKIGDGKEKMLSVYGSDYKQDGAIYNYPSGDMQLQFTVKDDVVMGITYALKTE